MFTRLCRRKFDGYQNDPYITSISKSGSTLKWTVEVYSCPQDDNFLIENDYWDSSHSSGPSGGPDTTCGSSACTHSFSRSISAHFGRAAELLIGIGDRSGHSHALAGLGSVRAALGQDEQAHADFRAALALAHETGEPDAEFQALSDRGEALRRAGRLDEALSHDQAALELVQEVGQPRDYLLALDGVARTLQAMGRTGEARGHWERALEHYSDADVLEVAAIRVRLAALDIVNHPGRP